MDEVDLIIDKIDATERHAQEQFTLIRSDVKALDHKVDCISKEVVLIGAATSDLPQIRTDHTKLKARVDRHITTAEAERELGIKDYTKKYAPPATIIVIIAAALDFFISGGLI